MVMAEAPGTTRTNWGRWGDDDERGALNLITPETVLEAVRSVRTGKVYSLALPIQREGVPILDYRGAPQRLTLMNQADPGMFSAFGAPPDVGANEDVLVMASHSITHMDALCHVFAGGHLYNGHPADSFRTHTGAPVCGIDKVGAVAGRAVVLDLPGHFGVEWLEHGYTITGDDLEACAARQGVEVRPGDILLVRTGYVDFFATLAGATPPFQQAGIGYDAVEFVADHDVAVVGSDNSAVEVIPFDRGVFLGIHIELLVKLGVHLIEHLRLTELALDGVGECLFVAGPLRITGGTGSPVNPVAIA
jgi:kynurenine formamidase